MKCNKIQNIGMPYNIMKYKTVPYNTMKYLTI